MRLLAVLVLSLGVLSSVYSQNSSTARREEGLRPKANDYSRIVINNQFFSDLFSSGQIEGQSKVELWDYQGAVFGEYDKDTLLILTGSVNQVEKQDDNFVYYILADKGMTTGASMIVGFVPERVKQVQVGSEVALMGIYLQTSTVDYTNTLTGVKMNAKTPVISILAMGLFYPGIGPDFSYKRTSPQ